ncbi:FAD-binding protein [Myxococcus sp. SDU36]|uniref:FAD-binding protein n=1 Tax=Myxococcus sp. SDU36 TaxID=2831967 RepID=UPI002542F751|nr:FAD-binding protein [Myxococcus sp. SDU36]WIG96760.1 FAD-binding protein [Myxococcus sp. SDU36]
MTIDADREHRYRLPFAKVRAAVGAEGLSVAMSTKLSAGRIDRNRYGVILAGAQAFDALNAGLLDICRDLGLPAAAFATVERLRAEYRVTFVGAAEDGETLAYRLYFGFQEGQSPLSFALDWTVSGEAFALREYHRRDPLSPEEARRLIRESLGCSVAEHEGAPVSHEALVEAFFRLLQRGAYPDTYEVKEEGSSRRSIDFSAFGGHSPGEKVLLFSDVGEEVAALAEELSVPRDAYAAWYASARGEYCGRVAIGSGRRGQPFVTLYGGPRMEPVYTRPSSGDVVDALRARLGGALAESPRSAEDFREDFGRRVRKTPHVIVKPADEQDVLHAFDVAGAHQVPLAIRGSGHSSNAQTLVDGGVVLSMGLEAPRIEVLKEGRVRVSAGARWGDVQRALERQGRSMAVLPDYLSLTVGGTLSAGGYGPWSISHGGQIDQVVRLRLAMPSGQAVWCARDEHPELFRFTLSGQGQLGAITEVILRTVPHRPFTLLRSCLYPRVEDLLRTLASLRDSAEGPDVFCGSLSRNVFQCMLGFSSVEPPRLTDARLDGLGVGAAHVSDTAGKDFPWWLYEQRERWVGEFPGWKRLWSDYAFEWSAFCSFMEFFQQELQSGEGSEYLAVAYLLTIRPPDDKFSFAFEPVPPSPPKLLYTVGLYYMVPRDRPAAEAQVARQLSKALERCITLGGRPYLHGAHAISGDQARSLYGGAMDELAELKRRCDPKGVLRNSPFGSVESLALPPQSQEGTRRSPARAAAASTAAPEALEQVYVLGSLGYDFESEAPKRSLVQAGLSHPEDTGQLLSYLDSHPEAVDSLVWTVCREKTPIYALAPRGAFAREIHDRLRELLRRQLNGAVSRVAVPGWIVGEAPWDSPRKVPLLVPALRGLDGWPMDVLKPSVIGDVESFLARVHHELQNPGRSARDRALNFAAMHLVRLGQVFGQALEDGLAFGDLRVEASPLQQVVGDHWDVILTFFHPTKRIAHARRVSRLTVDVSDVVPTAVGQVRSYHVY